VCAEINVVANDTRPYAMLGTRVVPDTIQDFGPIAGLYAGLQAMSTDLAVAVAVDMPFLNPVLLRAMTGVAAGWDAVIPALALPASADVAHKRAKDLDMHPLHAVYRRTCLPFIRATIDRDDRRLNAFLPAVRVRYFTADEIRVYDPGLRSLLNVNTPEELRGIERGSP
jgi:molybdopterin-guanine dinucleotide biosynthesis protein A